MEDNEWVCGKCGMPRNAAANTYRPVERIFLDSPNEPAPRRTEKKGKTACGCTDCGCSYNQPFGCRGNA